MILNYNTAESLPPLFASTDVFEAKPILVRLNLTGLGFLRHGAQRGDAQEAPDEAKKRDS